MKRLDKLKYIAFRAVFIWVVLLVGMTGFFVIGLFLYSKGQIPLSYLLTIIIFITILNISVFHYIYIPYRQSEKMMSRLLDGYEISSDMLNLTPSIEKQILKIETVLRSPDVMEINKRQAQYLALQNQINPHFLYNTLESIRSEAMIAQLDSVADMTEALALFFRYTISKVENLVSVAEELENCKTYFSIQKYRFGDRIDLHIEYDEEEWEGISRYKVPKLTLQPILENSIIHGTELKIGTGNLVIRFECTQSRLLIRVSDDGVGMDEQELSKLNEKLRNNRSKEYQNQSEMGGIALVNVNNRIHLLFGEEYGMHVYSVLGIGTDVEISLPTIHDNEL
ncbi:MAG: histidine kinase [Lachnospiraceae bacterium]